MHTVGVTITITMEPIDAEHVPLPSTGTTARVTIATVSDELVTAHHDLWVRRDNIKVSAVVVGDDATPTITYVLDTDYELNPETGSIRVLSTGAITDLQVVFVDYTFATYDQIEAITSSIAPERWILFEGLNIADGENPVVIVI